MINKRALLPTILWTGLLAGTLDISSAFVDYYTATGKNPLWILKYIASGIYGPAALTDPGAGVMALGLFLHYLIAFSFTFFFFWIYPKIPLLAKNRIVTAILYGLFIWMVMNLVVLQLSAAPHAPLNKLNPLKALKGALILITMLGLPLSFSAYKTYITGLKTSA